MKLTEGMLWERIDAEIERAVKDAHTYGAGWLMVDQNGRIRRVTPAKVADWGVRQDDSK